MKKYLFTLFIAFFALSSSFSGGRSDKIFRLVETGTAAEIKKEIRYNSDSIYSVRGPEKETLLMAAAKSDRNAEIFKLLIKAGAQSKIKTKGKKTALMYACQYNTHDDVVRLLIEDDAFLSSTKRSKCLEKDKNGKDCFDYAQENQNKNEIIAVLKKYAPLPEKYSGSQENQTSEPETPPAAPEEAQESPEPEEAEAEPPAEAQEPPAAEEEPASPPPVPNIEDTVPETEPEAQPPAAEERPAPKTEITEPAPEEIPPQPAETPEAEAAQNVPETIPSPQVSPYRQEYLFDYAEMNDDEEIPEESVGFNSKYNYIQNADKKDLNGRTPLMKAAKEGNVSLMEDLLYSGANINAQDNDGWTALMFAARFSKNEKATALLIKKGADVKKRNNYGLTALILASGFAENSSIVNFLLTNRSVAENEVRSAFIYAITNDAPISTVDLFVKKGLKINIAYDGKTPLMYAAKTNRSTKIIEYLLNTGAKTSYKSSEGKTAFQYAKENARLPHDGVYWRLNSMENGKN